MGKRYLIDTNVVLDFMGNKFTPIERKAISQIIDDQINLSVINKIELLGFSMVEQDLIDFVNCANIYPIDDDIVSKTIDVRRQYKIKLPDAIIAATALLNTFTLITGNIKDFKNIKGLKIIHPGDL